MMERKVKEEVGMMFRVPLRDGTYGYGQVPRIAKCIFFDHRDPEDAWTPVEEILKKPMIFYVTVDKHVIEDGIWKSLGVWPVDPPHQKFPDPFGWDYFKKQYTIWQTGVGKTFVNQADIDGRELLASWGHIAVEDRLRDHFAKRPNYLVEESRNRLNPDFPKSITEFYKQYGIDIDALHKKYYGEHILDED